MGGSHNAENRQEDELTLAGGLECTGDFSANPGIRVKRSHFLIVGSH